MPWLSRLLRGERVFVRVGDEGRPVAGTDGRVEVIYKAGGKVYRAALRNLADDPAPKQLDDGAAEAAPAPSPTPQRSPRAIPSGDGRAHPPRAAGSAPPAGAAAPFIIYADGACTGNPGPCGIGVVLLDGAAREEISEYLGQGTNNIAELTAIIRALERSPRDRAVRLHSDSSYALGLLGQGWKAKANQEIVERMRRLAREFRDLKLIKVAGHAGIPENERADALARAAVVRRR